MSSLENVYSLQHKLMLLDLLSSAKLSKNLQTFATQIEPNNVVHFFKCMESSCDFSTNDSDLFLIHLSAHWENSFVCIYCRETISSDVQLVQHMITNHNDRVYQCAFCFFRSRTKPHLVVHSISVHKNDTVCGYLCKKLVEVPRKDGPADTLDKAYVCTIGSCKLACLSTDNFLKHLYKEHPNVTCFVCHKCTYQSKNPEELVSHYNKVHNFKPYQCLYCSVGSDDEWKVMEHISQVHADHPFKLLIRSSHPPVWFKQVNTMVKESKLVPLPEGGCTPGIQDEVCAKNEPSPNTAPESKPQMDSDSVINTQEAHSSLPTRFVCSVENCAYFSNSATTFLDHIKEDHASVPEFSCPCCSFLPKASLSEFYVHLVDNHTTLLRCLYKNCSFVGRSREAVDGHVISVHQQYEDDLEDPDESECHDVPPEESFGMEDPVVTEDIKQEQDEQGEQVCEQLEKENMDTVPEPVVGQDTAPEKWLSDAELREIAERESTSQIAMEEVPEQPIIATTLAGSVEPEDNVPEPPSPLPDEIKERYVCSLCCQSEMEALEYFRHMSHGHGVKYFCGHCDRCYKVHRQLLTHHLRFHAGEEMSFKTFQDNSLMNVPQKMISIWQQDTAKQKKKKTKVIAREEKVSKDAPPSTFNDTEPDSEKLKSNRTAKTSLSDVDTSPKHETTKGAAAESQGQPLPVGKDVLSKKKPKEARNVRGTTTCKGAGNTTKGSKKTKDKLASPQRSKIKTKVLNENQSPTTTKILSLRSSSREAKSPKNVPSKDTEQKIQGATVALQPNGLSSREQLVQSESPAAHDSPNTSDVPPKSAVAHVCIYCSKSYKVLKWALRHQRVEHPDKPSMVKLLELSKLESSVEEKEPSEQLTSQDVESSVQLCSSGTGETSAAEKDVLVISLIDDDDDDGDDVPQCIEQKKTWKRICVISSDSEDDEPGKTEGFSYYGMKVTPIPIDNIFVYLHRGGVTIAYSQLAAVMKLQPIVRLKRLNESQIPPSEVE